MSTEFSDFLMNYNSSLFFLIELGIAIRLTTGKMSIHENVCLRLAIGLAAEGILSIVLCLLFGQSDVWLIENTVMYLMLFAIALLPFFLVYKERPMYIISCGVTGYMIQHIASQPLQVIWTRQLFENYNAGVVNLGKDFNVSLICLFIGSTLVVYGLVYVVCYLLFVRPGQETPFSQKAEGSFFQLAITTLLVVLVLSSVRDHYASESFALMMVSRGFSVCCCLFLLYLRSGILRHILWDSEVDTLRRLRQMDQELYREKKETVELINQKCHDMRHQIDRWEREGRITDPDEITRMKNLIRIYDASIRTGNKTLDLLLTDKKLKCEQYGIPLNAIVDGGALSFMSEADLCSLFGNLLDNAIEAVSQLPAQERQISLQVQKRHGMVVISEDNPYLREKALSFINGLPRTTKNDEGYHGYGTRSMQMITDKYGGQMEITADSLFHVGILIPLLV